jgi:hypothetical protein
MKKLLIVVLALSLVGLAVGCGDDGDECTAGTLNCACLTGDTCTGALVCNTTTAKCEEASCCTNAMVHVNGVVKNPTTQQGVAVAVGPIAPMEFILGTATAPINQTTSAADGTFSTDCFDASDIAMGMVVLADDTGFDGVGGTYFPTGTGVKAWGNAAADKVCIEDAAAFVMPNTFVTALGAIPGFDAAGNGFAFGFVVTAAGAPVDGAVIKKADLTDLAGVVYPNADFTDFSGTATSANGAYLILDLPSVTPILPVKTGLTFRAGGYSAATLAGFCYFLNMPAE